MDTLERAEGFDGSEQGGDKSQNRFQIQFHSDVVSALHVVARTDNTQRMSRTDIEGILAHMDSAKVAKMRDVLTKYVGARIIGQLQAPYGKTQDVPKFGAALRDSLAPLGEAAPPHLIALSARMALFPTLNPIESKRVLEEMQALADASRVKEE
ncbi:hypothetical protein HY969_02890 [Candidatus Kaiserbacteria bacterium]|nr:hypothetical protein [Candidatus Kaiserbacteria bacterium]